MYYITLISFIIAVLSFSYLFLVLVKRNILHEKVDNYNLKFIISCSFTILFWLTTYSLNAVYERIQNPYINDNGVEEYSGTLGDLIGGTLNPILALFGILAGGLAFYAQYQANKQVQDQFKIQQFESQFFEMLRLHKENINEMKISGYGILLSNSIEMENGKIIETTTRTQTERPIEGRKVFVSMIKELHFCCDYCVEFNLMNGKKYTKNDMLELGYKIFFHSSSSKFIANNFVKGEFIKSIKKELKAIRTQHKATNGTYNSFNINGKSIDLHIKYTPFTGHASRLGHYYRHLFYIVKFVVENENKKLFDYKKSREYLKLLRAQMSNDEQLLLYYNFKIGFGVEWENETNKFLSKYRMLHNLPTGKVKYADPLVVFEDQIRQIAFETNSKEKMFEWGDGDE